MPGRFVVSAISQKVKSTGFSTQPLDGTYEYGTQHTTKH